MWFHGEDVAGLGFQVCLGDRLVQMADPFQLRSFHGADRVGVFDEFAGHPGVAGKCQAGIRASQRWVLEDMYLEWFRGFPGKFYLVRQVLADRIQVSPEEGIIQATSHGDTFLISFRVGDQ